MQKTYLFLSLISSKEFCCVCYLPKTRVSSLCGTSQHKSARFSVAFLITHNSSRDHICKRWRIGQKQMFNDAYSPQKFEWLNCRRSLFWFSDWSKYWKFNSIVQLSNWTLWNQKTVSFIFITLWYCLRYYNCMNFLDFSLI